MFGKKNSDDEIKAGLRALYPRLWRYCVVLTGNAERANDLAQSACLRGLEKSGQFEPGSQLDRWMFRIAQRIWLNELRSDAVRRGGGLAPIEDIDIADGRPDPESNFFTREVLTEVSALPEAQRVAVVLAYVEGYSYRETAEILDIPIGTVMSRLSAARSKLVSALGSREGDVG